MKLSSNLSLLLLLVPAAVVASPEFLPGHGKHGDVPPPKVPRSVLDNPFLEAKFPGSLRPRAVEAESDAEYIKRSSIKKSSGSACNLPSDSKRFNVYISTANCDQREPLKLSWFAQVPEECITWAATDNYSILSLPAGYTVDFTLVDEKAASGGRSFTVSSDEHDSSILTKPEVHVSLQDCPADAPSPATCRLPIWTMTIENNHKRRKHWGGNPDGEQWSCNSKVTDAPERFDVSSHLTRRMYTGEADLSRPTLLTVEYCAPADSREKAWC